ncbi:MAG: patatin-like phospholipase family protein [Candidatus Marinimicrobia bacterium]|jgi:NTE family protein|nr:patatin-like phospholipase family protein [Candidatus Neomarinimicrobiota bacterium]|tara:strand:+ start:226 stop:1122 length:897 start_codon:yes stop_codon:yes gene_type:complete
MKIGLGLGGGGARGLVHIGIFHVLHAHKIPLSVIAGTSAGAIVGAMFAATRDPEWIENRFKKFFNHDVFKKLGTDRMIPVSGESSPLTQFAQKVRDRMVIALSMQRSSIVKKSRLKDALSFLIPVATFSELLVPLRVAATDLVSSNTIVYSEGDLVEAVVQSSSIPGYVEPTLEGDAVIIDGGIGMPNPVSLLADEAEFLISVDIKKELTHHNLNLNIYDILQRSEEVTHYKFSSGLASKAQHIVRPRGMHHHWAEFNEMDSLLKKGKEAMEKNVQQLRNEIESYFSYSSRIKRWFGI